MFSLLLVILVGAFFLRIRNSFWKSIKMNRQFWVDRLPGRPGSVKGADEAKLQAITNEMTALGFELLEDHLLYVRYTPEPVAAPVSAPIADPFASSSAAAPQRIPSSFTRAMVHRQHGCLGSISFSSVRNTDGRTPRKAAFALSVTSLTGTGDDDWTYTTGTQTFKRNARATMKLLRRGRSVSTSVENGSPAQILKVHLARRDDVAQAAGIAWKTDLGIEDEHQLEERAYVHVREVFGQLKPLPFLFKFQRLMWERKKTEWMGDLTGRIPNASPGQVQL